MAKKKVVTSGTTWGDEQYSAAGYGRIGIRIPLVELAALDRLAARWGICKTDAIRHMIAHAGAFQGPLQVQKEEPPAKPTKKRQRAN